MTTAALDLLEGSLLQQLMEEERVSCLPYHRVLQVSAVSCAAISTP